MMLEDLFFFIRINFPILFIGKQYDEITCAGKVIASIKLR